MEIKEIKKLLSKVKKINKELEEKEDIFQKHIYSNIEEMNDLDLYRELLFELSDLEDYSKNYAFRLMCLDYIN